MRLVSTGTSVAPCANLTNQSSRTVSHWAWVIKWLKRLVPTSDGFANEKECGRSPRLNLP
jgi:hypothetical protein